MPSRSPLTLWRLLAGDLLRILAVSGTALVVVIALAGAVRPLADGQIAAWDALKLTALLVVPMLQFALPFAAAFAATLSYHRFAADNEAVAASVGTIGYASILFPAAAIGLALTLLLGALTNLAIPHFLRGAERLVQSDLASLLVTPIRRGQAIEIDNLLIHADRAVGPLIPEGADRGARHVALYGVLAVRDDGRGDPSYYNAERVDLWLSEDPESPEGATVVMRFTGATTNADEGALRNESFTSRRIRIPRSLTDDPKYMTWPELAALPERPRAVAAVDRRAHQLSARLNRQRLLDEVRARLDAEGRVAFRGAEAEISVNATALEPDAAGGWRLAPAAEGARLTATVESPASAPRTLWAEGARLTLAPIVRGADVAPMGAPALRLDLENVTNADPGAPGAGVVQPAQSWPGLRLPGLELVEARATLASLEAEAAAAIARGADLAPDLERAVERVGEKSEELGREIVSKLHERAAFSVACLVMVLSGAVVALRLRDSLPLPVYLWSFFPALAAVVTISSGERFAYRFGWPGLLLVWGGVAALAVYTLGAYLKLRRH
jgi:lipopolysaccharide export system permease protein